MFVQYILHRLLSIEEFMIHVNISALDKSKLPLSLACVGRVGLINEILMKAYAGNGQRLSERGNDGGFPYIIIFPPNEIKRARQVRVSLT